MTLSFEEVIRATARIHENGLGPDAELFGNSHDEWQLRKAIEHWQERTQHVVYGCMSPQPPFVRAMLAYGNLKLMQREAMGLE